MPSGDVDPIGIEWEDLRDALYEASRANRSRVVLSLSSCEGAYAIKIGAKPQPCPFYGIVGSLRKKRRGEFDQWFTIFFKQLRSGNDAYTAAAEASAATGFKEIYYVGRDELITSAYEFIKTDAGMHKIMADSKRDAIEDLREWGFDTSDPVLIAQIEAEYSLPAFLVRLKANFEIIRLDPWEWEQEAHV